MEFNQPSFLYGLLALAIPVIIHLFSFKRYKRIVFPNVRFLKEVKEETQSKSKLKHLLILLSRMLALACLVFAFSEPFIPSKLETNTTEKTNVVIYVDNSFSMNSEGEVGTLLQNAKQNALSIANGHKASTQYKLLTNDFEIKHQYYVSQKEIIELIEDIQPSATTKTATTVLSRITDGIPSEKKAVTTVYYISDFQQQTTSLAPFEEDTTYQKILIPQSPLAFTNLYIDSIWFNTPVHQVNEQEKLTVRIVNTSSSPITDVPVKLLINGTQKALNSVTIPANSSVDSSLYYSNTSNGIQSAVVAIEDYPITFDDAYYFNYTVADSINILCLSPKDSVPAIRKLINNESLFVATYVSPSQLDYSIFKNYATIILPGLESISTGLASELQKFTKNGGSIIVFPPNNLKKNEYKTLTNQLGISGYDSEVKTSINVKEINTSDALYNSVFVKIPENINLPKVNSYYPPTSNNASISLLQLTNGKPFLNKQQLGSGMVYQFFVPLTKNASNFRQHALFVPTLYRMFLLSFSNNKPAYIIGKDNSFTTKAFENNQVAHIIQTKNNLDIIPAFKPQGNKTQLILHEPLPVAENYEIQVANKVIDAVSFNYSKEESIPDCYTSGELEEEIKNPTVSIVDGNNSNIVDSIASINEGTPLWKLFIILTLTFLGIEILLIKLWKS